MLLNCTAAYKYKLYNSIIVVLYLLNPFFGVKYKAYNGCNDICLISPPPKKVHFTASFPENSLSLFCR